MLIEQLAPLLEPYRMRPAGLCGGAMIRISLTYLYDLGVSFSRLREELREGRPLSEVRYVLSEAEDDLGTLFHPQAIYAYALRGSSHDATMLFEAIKKITTQPDQTRPLDFLDVFSIKNALEKFETVLRAEMRAADAYFVSKKGGYDTTDIITRAEVLFPDDLTLKAPEAVVDIQEAGKCIAYELGTAAGFHLLRANESVLLRYFDTVAGEGKRPANANLGVLLKRMSELNVGDSKVLAVLTQIKDLHRNPLFHPQDQLTVDQAINLLGIVRSAVSAMLDAIPLPAPPKKNARKRGAAS